MGVEEEFWLNARPIKSTNGWKVTDGRGNWFTGNYLVTNRRDAFCLSSLDDANRLIREWQAYHRVDGIAKKHRNAMRNSYAVIRSKPRKWIVGNGIGGFLSPCGRIFLSPEGCHFPSEAKAEAFHKKWKRESSDRVIDKHICCCYQVIEACEGEAVEALKASVEGLEQIV